MREVIIREVGSSGNGKYWTSIRKVQIHEGEEGLLLKGENGIYEFRKDGRCRFYPKEVFPDMHIIGGKLFLSQGDIPTR